MTTIERNDYKYCTFKAAYSYVHNKRKSHMGHSTLVVGRRLGNFRVVLVFNNLINVKGLIESSSVLWSLVGFSFKINQITLFTCSIFISKPGTGKYIKQELLFTVML